VNPFQCFMRKIEKGIVVRELGMNLVSEIEAREKALLVAGTKADALRLAAQLTADDAAQIAARKAELAVAHIEAQLNVLKTARKFEDALGARRAEGTAPLWLKDITKSPLFSAMRALLTRDNTELASPFNVYYMARNIRGQAHAMFTDGIEALRPGTFGLDQKSALQIDVLRAIKDKSADVSPQARSIAESWAKMAEFLREMFVDAKGALPFRADWGLPNPVHDTLKIRGVPKQEWIDFIERLLDRKAMIDFDTGRALMPKKRQQLLGEMYDTVIAGGKEGGPTSAFTGQKALAQRRAEHRFIVFKNADAWIEYQERFGSGQSVFDVMINHIENMADDIAMLRVLGPNPEATKRFILSLFDREAARMTRQAPIGDAAAQAQALKDNTKIAGRIASGRRQFETMYAEVTGANKIPVDMQAAHVMGEARALLTGAQMGSAILSSITDPALMTGMARMNDIPAMKVLSTAIAGMADGTFELKAAQLGLVADSATMRIQHNDRIMGETIRSGMLSRVANGVIQASGLRRWSGVLRSSFAMETMAVAANRMALAYDQLPAGFRQMLGRYDIEAKDWAQMQKATPSEPRPGAQFLTAADIRAAGGDDAARRLGDRWQMLIDTEMDHAVIEGDPATRALILGQSRPGTPEGELRRSVGQYKGFPITFALMHFSRAFARGWDGQRLGHSAVTFAAMWAMGMVAMQAKEVAKGRDPITMDPTTDIGRRAWGAAALQGGGFGIFGDFLFADQTRNGTTLAATLAGPSFAAVEKVFGDFLMANIQRAWKGQETHFAGDALYAAAGLVPGSSLWYWRTAFQRGIIDQLALMIDDRAPERFERIEREAQKTWGQSFYWEPGRVDPRRAPSPGAAFGGQP
jgi:hypothetical protein